MYAEDHPAPTHPQPMLDPPSDFDSDIFDPDRTISQSLLMQLASATSVTSTELCRPFIKTGTIITSKGTLPIQFNRFLLDTGAQGSNFISEEAYLLLPKSHLQGIRDINKVVRLGDARHLSVQVEVRLHTSILDSQKVPHTHTLWYSVLPTLSHDIIIGLVDLIGPYYEIFEDALHQSRTVSINHDLGYHIPVLTDEVKQLSMHFSSDKHQQQVQLLRHKKQNYVQRKTHICASSATTINTLALQDGSATNILSNPTHGTVYADDRIENRYEFLSSMLLDPRPGQIIPPWSRPIDAIAPEEENTPDPTNFPDDILMYLTTSIEDARHTYRIDLATHVTDNMRSQCPDIMTLLQSQLAYDVFVPHTWTGIRMTPYHLDVKPGLPDHIKAHARPVRAALFQDAKTEFSRMQTYFYEKSSSPIASPLVIAPKATALFIRICGDYRTINPYVCIPQEPIPHVQQSLAKAAGWKVFVDLDMTNSFHQIPIDDFSSNLLSVSTPWGLFRPKFLPEGVGPASGILQSIVRRIFADFDDWIIVIFDNFLILASDYSDAAAKLSKVLIRCKDYGLVLKMKKSWIGTTIVTFFGYEVQPGSWQLSESRKAAISSLIFPTNQKQMQSFLGAANFFHTHIPNYASWASSLYECTVTGFDWDPTKWKKDYKTLFGIFKDAINKSTTLYFPDYSLPWIIRSDASDHAVGAVLFQEFTTSAGTIIHQPIAFVSHKFSGAAVNWDTFKQEAYGLYFAVIKLSYYLRGKQFTVETDHRNLLWIENSQVPIVIRWRVLLQSFNFTVKHIPGKENTVADWLSRMYPVTPDTPFLSITTNPSLHDMFTSVHGGRSLHHGAKRTYLALCSRYPGHGIPLRVIQDLVSECPICQKDRLPNHPIPHSTIRETLMHHQRTIGMDHVSVTPADEDGYIALLLVVELDTKFPHAYPVRDYSAETASIALFKHYCTYGTYDAIFSDPGSAFTSDVVQHLNKWLGIPHHISVVGRHESNGTEHVNAIFLGHLRRLVHDERLTRRWASDTILPLINHALAATPNSELGGISPAELKFGTVDFNRFKLPPPLVPGTQYSALIIQLDKNLQTVRSITHAYQAELRSARQAPTLLQQQNKFNPNDLILWNSRENPSSFRPSKLSPKLLGPYAVIEQNKNNIKCRHVISNKISIFHADRVTPFIGTKQSAEDVALLDNDEYVVEKILAHRGNFRQRTSLEFLVRWSSYSSDSDSWEPWTSLLHVEALHDYLRQINRADLIPSVHKK